MELILEPEAEQDLERIKSEHQSFVKAKLEELEDKSTGHENSEYIRINQREVFKYVMKIGNRGGKDYRAIYDIIDNQIRIVAILHRDQG